MKQALNILIGYLTCTDPIIQNKWLNLLNSFWHKDDGKLVKLIEPVVGGYQITVVNPDGTETQYTIAVPEQPQSQPIAFVDGLQGALDNKVDKAIGKTLTSNDFTTALKNKLDGLSNYIHPEFHQINEIEGLSAILEGKMDIAVFDNHAANQDIHVTADQKKTYANKLKTYVAGEVIQDVIGDVFRIFDNKIYSLNAALPYTTNDIVAETDNEDWTVELEAPEAGLTFKDADGIDQFTGSFALFEGFGFDVASKKLINPKTHNVQHFFDAGIEIGKYSPTSGGRSGLEIRKLGTDAGDNVSPKKYQYKAKNRLSSNWAAQHDFMLNEEVLATIYGKHNAVDSRYLQIFGKLVVDFLATFTTIKVQGNAEIYKLTQILTSGQNASIEKNIINENPFATAKTVLKANQSGGWRSKYLWTIIRNNGFEIDAFTITDDPVDTDKIQAIFNGSLKMDSLDLSALGKYADDAAAGAAGVPLNFAYINSATGAVHSRQS